MPSQPSAVQIRQLEAAARAAARQAYAPYSKFRVGAAVLTDSGKIFSGCNVENASYGLSNCAERTAIFQAVSNGARRLRAVAIYTPTKGVTAPCGACRQVIFEFSTTAQVICFCNGKGRLEVPITALLPGAFGPDDLG